jgi:hypothetical protein
VAPARTLQGGRPTPLQQADESLQSSSCIECTSMWCSVRDSGPGVDGMCFSVLAVSQCESCASVNLINRQGLLAFQFKKLRMGAASLAILSRRSMTRLTMTCMACIEMTCTCMEKLRSGHRRNLATDHVFRSL